MTRFDVCEAHQLLEWDYNVGGWLHERTSNRRRHEATSVQLHRMGFRPARNLSFDTLTDEGKEVYLTNVLNLGLPCDDEQKDRLANFFDPSWLRSQHPQVFAA